MGTPSVADDFARAAKTVTGLELGVDVVNFIFLMFDEDGRRGGYRELGDEQAGRV